MSETNWTQYNLSFGMVQKLRFYLIDPDVTLIKISTSFTCLILYQFVVNINESIFIDISDLQNSQF